MVESCGVCRVRETRARSSRTLAFLCGVFAGKLQGCNWARTCNLSINDFTIMSSKWNSVMKLYLKQCARRLGEKSKRYQCGRWDGEEGNTDGEGDSRTG